MTRSILLLLTIAALAVPAEAAITTTYTSTHGIEYARVGGDSMQLDLHVPDGSGPWPVILYLHSGAWITGERTETRPIRQAARGYAVASIDYPLAPRHIWPRQIETPKAAVRWLRANATRYNLDPERIGVMGTSSGGHLAAMLGTSGDETALEGVALGNPQFSSRVKAVVDFYGPTSLLDMDEQKLPCYGLSANSPWMPPSLLMGCAIQSCPEKTETSNPLRYITPDDPPFLILQGKRDCLVPWQQSQMLHDALRAAGLTSELHLLPTAEHSDAQFNTPEMKAIVDAFLDTHLRGPVVQTVPRRRAAR